MRSTKSHTKTINRKLATKSAVASVRAEGLNPSPATTRRLKDYAEGKLSAAELRQQTLVEARSGRHRA